MRITKNINVISITKKTMKIFLIGNRSYLLKAKSFQVIAWCVLLNLITLFTGCGGDQLDISNTPLAGSIDGNDWQSGSANAYRLGTNGQFRVRFLSDLEPVSDPCSLPSPGRTHVKAIFKPSIGSFSISPQAINDNQVQVAFEVSASKSLIVVSGYMEIFDINNATAVGFLSAEWDDNNKVEGAFRIRFCD